jgi:hypothetical protein
MALSKKIFTEVMALLGSYYEKMRGILKESTKTEMWYAVLQDMADDELKAATIDYVKTGKFAPTPADLWERVNAIREQDRGELTPEEAWGIVYRDISRFGYYEEPTYDDWKLEAAKNSIGWNALCDLTENTLMPTRAHFLRIYGSFVRREKAATQSNNPIAVAFVNRLAKELAGKKNVLAGKELGNG